MLATLLTPQDRQPIMGAEWSLAGNMYEAFYGFRDSPFRLTPDPEYLFLSTNHQEALGHLLFGVSEGSGVVVITGEIGTGKTTLLRTLVRTLDPQKTTVAYIFNPALSALELLQTINADLGLPATSTSKKELIDELNQFLLQQQAAGRRVVVIIDEAQDLAPSVLEQLRLLSNLETEREKLLHIVLVGQPELGRLLERPELAQLEQRVTLRWHLGPMNAEETAGYVRHRLRIATDGREPVRFTPAALRQLHRFSRGIPRVINVLCHRALLIGYTREERVIGPAVIHQAVREMRAPVRESPSVLARSPVALISAVLLLLLGGVFSVAWMRGWLSAPSLHRVVGTALTFLQAQSVSGPPASAPPAPHTLPPLASQAVSEAGPEPAVAERFMTAEAFVQELQRRELVESAIHATDGLLRAWQVAPLRSAEWRNGTLDLGAIARARHLEYLPFSGSLRLLSLLDLPAIVEVIVPERQEMRFVLLVGMAQEHCRVLLDRERDVPLEAMHEHWFGKAHVFWKDFENIGFLLTVGSVGQNVKRLHMLLSKVEELQRAHLPAEQPHAKATFLNRETFSKQTEQVVARFQRANRLTPDGVVGPLTMILLYNALPEYPRPRLTPVSPSLTQPGMRQNTSLLQGNGVSSREGT
ncbi:MAG: AAA family ATPase [Candidatus Binatia bacterium]|nr:AAA family ATPase [Candidatus Binatia bacterium]